MKKAPLLLVLLIAVSTVMIPSCKKKNTSADTETLPPHCSNGIIDKGEMDTDCGGECTACAAIVAPCVNTLTNNTIKLDGFADMNITFVDDKMESGNYTLTGNSDKGDILITLAGAAPTTDRAYYFISGTGPSSQLVEGQGNIQMGKGFTGSFYASAGKLYVAFKNGKMEVTFCNIVFQGDQSSIKPVGSGKMTTM